MQRSTPTSPTSELKISDPSSLESTLEKKFFPILLHYRQREYDLADEQMQKSLDQNKHDPKLKEEHDKQLAHIYSILLDTSQDSRFLKEALYRLTDSILDITFFLESLNELIVNGVKFLIPILNELKQDRSAFKEPIEKYITAFILADKDEYGMEDIAHIIKINTNKETLDVILEKIEPYPHFINLENLTIFLKNAENIDFILITFSILHRIHLLEKYRNALEYKHIVAISQALLNIAPEELNYSIDNVLAPYLFITHGVRQGVKSVRVGSDIEFEFPSGSDDDLAGVSMERKPTELEYNPREKQRWTDFHKSINALQIHGHFKHEALTKLPSVNIKKRKINQSPSPGIKK